MSEKDFDEYFGEGATGPCYIFGDMLKTKESRNKFIEKFNKMKNRYTIKLKDNQIILTSNDFTRIIYCDNIKSRNELYRELTGINITTVTYKEIKFDNIFHRIYDYFYNLIFYFRLRVDIVQEMNKEPYLKYFK